MKSHFLTLLLFSLLLSTSCSDEQLENSQESIIASNLIIGEDNRQIIRGNYDSYNRTVGQIVFELENDRVTLCTATAIGDRFIITAAHCFYQGSQLLKNAFFYPGRRLNQTMPFDRFPILEVFHPREYNPLLGDVLNSSADIAIARVGQDSGGRGLTQRVGFMGMWAINQVNNQRMRTIGYPGDKGNFVQYSEENCLATNNQPLHFTTTCDTFKGQSGSPALFYHEGSQAYYLRGIINSETHNENIVAKLTPTRKEIIEEIIKDEFSGSAWVKHRLQRDLRVRIIINNRCSRDLHVAVYRFENQGQTDGFYVVKPGQHYEVSKTTFASYRLHVRDTNGSILIGAHSSLRHSLHGNPHEFAQYTTDKWGDQVHTLCP